MENSISLAAFFSTERQRFLAGLIHIAAHHLDEL